LNPRPQHSLKTALYLSKERLGKENNKNNK
jgi:hypothetical protein